MLSSGKFLVRLINPFIKSTKTFFFGSPDQNISPPLIRDGIDLKRYMGTVLIAVLPSVIAGIYFFGLRVIAVIAVAYIFGVGTEAVFAAHRKQDEIHEGAFVTCILYALILPPDLPLWMVAVGIVFGTVFGKEIFGGTGKNIFNPAMVGRIFLSFAFPEDMSTGWIAPIKDSFPAGFSVWSLDSITSATPLAAFKSGGFITDFKDLFFGKIPGCIGETVKPLIILGGLYLMFTKVANWRIPVSFFLSAFLTAFIFNLADSSQFAPAWFHMLSGGLLFAGMFMISDPVTSPLTNMGKIIFGILLGALTILIRNFTGYVEGIMFAIIIMNAFAPLIDQVVLYLRYRRRNYAG